MRGLCAVYYLEVFNPDLRIRVSLVVGVFLTGDGDTVIKIPEQMAVMGRCCLDNVAIVATIGTEEDAEVFVEQMPLDRLNICTPNPFHAGTCINGCDYAPDDSVTAFESFFPDDLEVPYLRLAPCRSDVTYHFRWAVDLVMN